MKPFSAAYYIVKNKGRAAIIIFMMFLTMCMFLAGNYISSMWWYYDVAKGYDSRIILVSALSTDTDDYKDWKAFREDIKNDPELITLFRTGSGYGGGSLKTTIGLETGVGSYVFRSKEDMQTAMDLLGIDFDCSGLHDRSAVISENLSRNRNLKLGDLSPTKEFMIEGIMNDRSYQYFYLCEDKEENCYRANIMSKTLSGQKLIDRVQSIIGDRKVRIEKTTARYIHEDLGAIDLIFYVGLIILSVIMMVTLNSVVTGQYIKREYEFAVYRALGVSKGRIRRKIASELLLMDLIALLIGTAVMLLTTFLLNELLYIPRGQYLPYCSKNAIIGVVFSNLLILVPMILLKGRKMCKTDVTEF
ncbi:MAG: FtsX-like permease family protein [Lachnospiraceae bacterium]|nr:FtsX-like permease family protein [Lachnospiraceae bacterium]